jgi:hypothetical protein
MLNSKSKSHPGGVGNSSGLVGKYLHDSTGPVYLDFYHNYLTGSVIMKMALEVSIFIHHGGKIMPS